MRPRLIGVFSQSILADLTQKALSLVNSVVFMNVLGPDVTGAYFLVVATFGTIPAILASFDQLVTRFLPGVSESERPDFAASVLASKLYTCLGAGVIGIVIWQVFPVGNAAVWGPWRWELWGPAIIAFGVVPLISQWSNRVLAACRAYRFQIAIDVVQGVLTTSWILAALWGSGVRDLPMLVVGISVVATAAMIVRLLGLGSQLKGVGGALVAAVAHPRRAWTHSAWRHRQYLLPFLLTSVSGFLKDSFPVLVVGAVAEAKTIAEFRIIQQGFRIAHTIVPNAFEIVRPGLLGRLEGSGSDQFAVKYQRYASAYLLAAGALSVLTIVALNPLLSVWALDSSPVLYVVTTLLGLEFVFGAATHVEYQLFLLQERIGYLMTMSLIRQVATSLVVILGGLYWGQAGVALGAMTGALIAWIGFVRYTVLKNLRPMPDVRQTILIVCLVALAIAATGTAASRVAS